jgi:hypothetical protein
LLYLTKRPEFEEDDTIGEADVGGSDEGEDVCAPHIENCDGREEEHE